MRGLCHLDILSTWHAECILDCVLAAAAERESADYTGATHVSPSTLTSLTGLVNATWFRHVLIMPRAFLAQAIASQLLGKQYHPSWQYLIACEQS
jgi:hypothetical protein